MRIIIIANFTNCFDGERVGRFSYLMEALSDRGHIVELITSDFFHGTKSRRPEPMQALYKSKITLCHEPGYKKNISLLRLYSHWRWGHNVLKYLRTVEKPDIVYCAVPSLTATRLAAKYCEKNNIKFVTDVQDLWPEAFYMVVHKKVIQKLFWPLLHSANYIYSHSDLAVAVSETYVQRTLSVNSKRINGVSVYLGNDGELFNSERGAFRVERTTDDEILLCYVGGLKDSYDIQCVIDALAEVNNSRRIKNTIRFVLIGDGPLRARFEQYAKNKHVDCLFVGRKSYTEMASLLCSCDICINPIVKGSAASIINKVGDYALSGLPVINTQESREYRELLNKYGCGINCECGNSSEVAEAIINLAACEEKRQEMGRKSLLLAQERFDRRNTYMKIINELEKLAKCINIS